MKGRRGGLGALKRMKPSDIQVTKKDVEEGVGVSMVILEFLNSAFK